MSESVPPGFGMGVDDESSTVCDYVVVEPAEEDQVVEVGAASVCPWGEMVCFEPVAAVAAIGGTTSRIPVE